MTQNCQLNSTLINESFAFTMFCLTKAFSYLFSTVNRSVVLVLTTVELRMPCQQTRSIVFISRNRMRGLCLFKFLARQNQLICANIGEEAMGEGKANHRMIIKLAGDRKKE